MKRLAVLCLVSSTPAQAADARLTLSAPAEWVGDGRTVALTVTASPPDPLGALSLDSDAGEVGATRNLRPGVYEIDFTPPRVAVAQKVSLSATVAGSPVGAPVVMKVLPAPLLAAERASGGPLDLRAPSRVLLGSDAPVTLTLKKTALRPSLSASAGTLGPIEARGDRWRARFTPPRERSPRVVLIGAAAGDTVDWLAIQLYGVGRIETRTKPGARLTVRVGDAEFGPFRADATGRVETSVVAPPGTPSARVHAVDKLGNEKDAPIDLGTPAFARVLALCSTGATGAPGAPGTVDLFVVDQTGAPADDQGVAAVAAGTRLSLTRVGPGHFRARLAGGGSIAVRASLDGQESRCSVTPVPLAAPRRRFGLGVALGYLTNFGRLSAPLVTLDFAWRLPWRPRLLRNLSIGASTGFYTTSYTAGGAEPADVSVTAIPLLARIDYQIPLGPAALFAGVGGGLLLPVITAHSASASLSSTEVAGAFAARLGADFDVRGGRVVVEAGYWVALVSHGDVTGNFGGLSALVGWRLEL